MKTSIIAAALAMACIAGAADAHPRLTGVSPSTNAAVSSPETIRLTFSERLIPKLSHINLIGADGKSVATTAESVGAGGKQLSAKPAIKLKPGRYTINWTAVSVDTHRVQGKSQFAVR